MLQLCSRKKLYFSKLASQLFSPCFSTSMCDMRDRRVCPMLTLMWVIFIIDMRKLVIDLSAVFFQTSSKLIPLFACSLPLSLSLFLTACISLSRSQISIVTSSSLPHKCYSSFNLHLFPSCHLFENSHSSKSLSQFRLLNVPLSLFGCYYI